MRRCISVLVCLVLFGCESLSDDAAKSSQTEINQRQWLSYGQDYQFIFQQHCYCTEEYLKPMRIQVNQGVISTASYIESGEVVKEPVLKDLPTVNSVFEKLLAEETVAAESLIVEFDEKYHYPKSVKIDYSKRMADDEIYWLLSELEFITE